jgi:hypothetical protein
MVPSLDDRKGVFQVGVANFILNTRGIESPPGNCGDAPGLDEVEIVVDDVKKLTRTA